MPKENLIERSKLHKKPKPRDYSAGFGSSDRVNGIGPPPKRVTYPDDDAVLKAGDVSFSPALFES